MVVTRRPAGRADEPFTRALHDAVRRPELAASGLADGVIDDLLSMQFAARETGYRQRFPEASAEIVLCDGVPVGRVLVDREGAEVHLVDIALLADHRGCGIGTVVLRELIEEARSSDRPLTLSVAHDNPALRLYRRLGFESRSEDEVYRQLIHRPGVR